jgi:hypothetical protein
VLPRRDPTAVGHVLGHTQADTTYRYVNANIETAKRWKENANNRQIKISKWSEEIDERLTEIDAHPCRV